MYYINYSKCSICNQKKSVASTREDRRRRCYDCDPEFYSNVAECQKEQWANNSKA